MRISSITIPPASCLANTSFHFSDSYSGLVIKNFQIEAAAKAFFNSAPKWVNKLMNIRNRIVKAFGLKAPGTSEDPAEILNAVKWQPGEEIGLFKIYDKKENELIFGQDDQHLNFRISLLKNHTPEGITVVITTIVMFNNIFGRIYFFPVKFFHKPIVKAMLRNLIRDLSSTT